jgi:hypothetical protein
MVLVTAMDPGVRVCNLNTMWVTSGGAAVIGDVNCCLPSGAMDPPSHWSATTRIPAPVPVAPAVEILWRSGVNWRITRIELWIGLWVKKFLPELAGKSCQARRRDDKK